MVVAAYDLYKVTYLHFWLVFTLIYTTDLYSFSLPLQNLKIWLASIFLRLMTWDENDLESRIAS